MIQILRSLFRSSRSAESEQSIELDRQSFEQLFEKFAVKPEVLFSDKEDDFAFLCGREMQLQRHKNQHDLVIALGQLAHTNNLAHERISINLQKSLQETSRHKKLRELEEMRLSENLSRKDYESAVVQAWMSDPDYSKYLDILKKIYTRKLKRDSVYCSASDDLKNELIDLQINRRILLELSSSEWKLVKDH